MGGGAHRPREGKPTATLQWGLPHARRRCSADVGTRVRRRLCSKTAKTGCGPAHGRAPGPKGRERGVTGLLPVSPDPRRVCSHGLCRAADPGPPEAQSPGVAAHGEEPVRAPGPPLLQRVRPRPAEQGRGHHPRSPVSLCSGLGPFLAAQRAPGLSQRKTTQGPAWTERFPSIPLHRGAHPCQASRGARPREEGATFRECRGDGDRRWVLCDWGAAGKDPKQSKVAGRTAGGTQGGGPGRTSPVLALWEQRDSPGTDGDERM